MNNDPRTKLNLKYYDFMASYRKAGTCFEYTDKALREAAINPWMPCYVVTFHQASALSQDIQQHLQSQQDLSALESMATPSLETW